MTKLQSRADHLQQENDRLRTCLEGERIENVRGSGHPTPPVKQNKGKEPIQSEDSDTATDDELSSNNSPLPDPLPPKNNVEADSRERPPRRSSRSVSGMPRQVRREFNRERRQLEHTPENIPAWLGVRHHHFRSGIRPSEQYPSRLCLYLLLSEDLKTCCHPH